MKKLVAFIMAAMLCVSLASCGGSTDTETTAPQSSAESSEVNSEETTAASSSAESAELKEGDSGEGERQR